MSMSELSAAEAMLARDRASASLGMTAISCVPGPATGIASVAIDSDCASSPSGSKTP